MTNNQTSPSENKEPDSENQRKTSDTLEKPTSKTKTSNNSSLNEKKLSTAQSKVSKKSLPNATSSKPSTSKGFETAIDEVNAPEEENSPNKKKAKNEKIGGSTKKKAETPSKNIEEKDVKTKPTKKPKPETPAKKADEKKTVKPKTDKKKKTASKTIDLEVKPYSESRSEMNLIGDLVRSRSSQLDFNIDHKTRRTSFKIANGQSKTEVEESKTKRKSVSSTQISSKTRLVSSDSGLKHQLSKGSKLNINKSNQSIISSYSYGSSEGSLSYTSSSSDDDSRVKKKGKSTRKDKEKQKTAKEKEKEKEKEKVDFEHFPEKEIIEEKEIGKKKKGKGKKGAKEEIKEVEEVPEVVLPDLQKLLGEKEEEEAVEEPAIKKKKKPKIKKKETPLTEKEKARLEEERRIAAEQEAIRLAEEERLRAIQERKMAIAKEKRDILEQQWRGEHLELSRDDIEAIKQAGWDALMITKIKNEWVQYLVCDGLPNPSNVPEMNTYLHLWNKEIETVTVEQAVHRTNEMHRLLDVLQKLIDDPFDEPERKQADWKWIRSLFRNSQKKNLDFCTYRLLRDVKTRMNRLDIPSSDFRIKQIYFSLCLWTLVELPTATPNPRQPPKPRVNLEWPEFDTTVIFPTSLKCDLLALRGMYVKYDHLSDTSKSYDLPPLPKIYQKSIIEMTNKEWYNKLKYKYDNRVIVPKEPNAQVILEDGTINFIEAEPEKTVPEISGDEFPPIVPYQKLEPVASDVAISIEKQEFDEALSSLIITMDPHKINLRKYFIIGGIFYLDLFHQPTQPQEMVSFEIFITTLQSPFCLQEAPFYVPYVPPPAPEPGVRRQPEEIEEELLIQERELDKLMFITLTLPTHVFWMDVPMVAHWDQKELEWTTADIHDFKHIEEKGYITFRTGKFGPFGIATYRFPNLPYQAWEVRPENDGTVTLQLTAAILMIEFHLKNHLVCISQLQNAPNAAMDGHIGKYYKLTELKRIMLDCGIDVFPSFDSFHYIKGTCEKHWPMEKHLYYCMAMAGAAYNFSWSRWNMTLDYRGIAMQMRRYKFDKNKQDNFSMVLVTPIKALMIDCTEVSTTFTEEPSGGETRFYADLIHLIRGISNMATKNKIAETPRDMINTLANLFIETRFLSFS